MQRKIVERRLRRSMILRVADPNRERKVLFMSGIVGVVLRLDLPELKMLQVLADPPVILGPRATKAAIEPLLVTESVRVFVRPIYRSEREEMFTHLFARYEMRFDPSIVEEVWSIPSKISRMVECRSIIVLSHENSVVYSTRNPFSSEIE